MAARLVFRSGREIHIEQKEQGIIIQGRTFTIGNHNTKYGIMFNLDSGEMGLIKKSSQIKNQVCLMGNKLVIPPENKYLELGLCDQNGYMQQTELETQLNIDCLVYAEQTRLGTKDQFFMRCGKFRFIPGDIRPIE